MQLEISQEELAFQIGTSQNAISKYERDISDPSAEKIVEIARTLQTTTDYLYGLTDNPERPLRNSADLDESELELLRLYRSKPPDERDRLRRIIEAV